MELPAAESVEITHVVDRLFTPQPDAPHGRRFVMTVGFSESGKATFVTSHPLLRTFWRIDTDDVHRALNETFAFLQDDWTIEAPAFGLRQALSHRVRRALLERAFAAGLDVVNDSANLERSKRASYLELAKHYGYRTALVHVVVEEAVLLERLRKRDEAVVAQGGKPTWVALYQQVQKTRLDPPESDEADAIVVYNQATDAPENVLLTL